jgi:hypothetical protein
MDFINGKKLMLQTKASSFRVKGNTQSVHKSKFHACVMRPFIPCLPEPGDPDMALAMLEHRIHGYLDSENVYGINVKLYLEIVEPL